MQKQTKIGISSFSYSYAVGFPGFAPKNPMTPLELAKKAVELDVDVVQIADNCPLHPLSEQELTALADYAGEHNLSIEVGTRGIKTDNLRRYIDIAQKLRSPILRVVIDTADHRPDLDEIHDLICAVLPELEEAGIILGIENHDRLKASAFVRILDRLQSPWVGIVLDTVNSFACQENTEQVLDALAKYTVNFHCKDFTIRRVSSNMGLLVTGTIAGEGLLNTPAVWERLSRDAVCDYSTILELWMNPCETAEETLVQEESWVRESVRNLKRMLSGPGL